MAAELESDLQDILDCGRKCLVDFNAGKTQFVSFDQSNDTGAIEATMYGSAITPCYLLHLLFLNYPPYYANIHL